MDEAAMEAVALRSLANLPEEFRRYLGDVVVRVQDLATREMLESVGLTHPMQLSGLYTGRPIDNKSVWDVSDGTPDRIYLFRLPILAEARERDIPVERLVHHVMIHEMGHHFGLSDDDMHALEDEA